MCVCPGVSEDAGSLELSNTSDSNNLSDSSSAYILEHRGKQLSNTHHFKSIIHGSRISTQLQDKPARQVIKNTAILWNTMIAKGNLKRNQGCRRFTQQITQGRKQRRKKKQGFWK